MKSAPICIVSCIHVGVVLNQESNDDVDQITRILRTHLMKNGVEVIGLFNQIQWLCKAAANG